MPPPPLQPGATVSQSSSKHQRKQAHSTQSVTVRQPSQAKKRSIELSLPSLQVPLVKRKLLDLKVAEVPIWTIHRLLSPKSIFHAICRSKCDSGHDAYYKKYIDVKKGGIGGISMFLMGYVILSYIWSFDHIKQDRWRKYH
ncbi:ATP synthase subunit f, mitochondrial isoform X3 [Carcharodon carcharias]|uniref:ATP synthase subunit f, mitochondrial isoform X3 n=1 Tax=Carcharodon carcharias TaxID=13397 RepID=UPI001B7E3614|nr:ATP synthase subunit f, mitochondrial isoform X3 [Carcharodon carcharias]